MFVFWPRRKYRFTLRDGAFFVLYGTDWSTLTHVAVIVLELYSKDRSTLRDGTLFAIYDVDKSKIRNNAFFILYGIDWSTLRGVAIFVSSY